MGKNVPSNGIKIKLSPDLAIACLDGESRIFPQIPVDVTSAPPTVVSITPCESIQGTCLLCREMSTIDGTH